MILTIRRKIMLAFLVVSLITGALGAYAVHGIGTTGGLVVQTFDQALMSIDYARAAAADFAAMETVFARRRLAAGDSARVAALDARQEELVGTLQDDLSIAGTRALSPRVTQAATAVSASVSRWLAARDRMRALPAETASWQELDRLQATVESNVDLLVNLAAGAGFRHRERALAEIDATRRATFLALGLALALSGVVAAMLAGRIMGPVRAASSAASAIAAGQLTALIPEAGRDELGQLLRAMATMRDSIRDMMAREVAQRRSAQAQLAGALHSSNEGIVLIDAEGRVAIANARLAALFPALAGHLTPGKPIARSLGLALGRGLFATAHRTARRALRARLLALGTIPVEACLENGTWLRISGSATGDGGLVAICSDITAIKQREADLRRVNFCLDAALSNMIQGLCLYGPDQTLRLANRRFGDIFRLDEAVLQPGTSLRDVLRASIAAGVHGDMTLASLEETTRAATGGGLLETRSVQVLADGRVIEMSHVPLADGGWVATYEDITERRQSEAQVTFLARHDPLTRLPNRTHLAERLEVAIAGLGRNARFALMCLDLDHFKPVNDTLGHGVGDKLLRAVSERLTACVRETDLVARLGGDEFAIVQTDLERAEQTGELAQRLIATLSQPFEIDDHSVTIGASVGIAVAPDDGALIETLLKNADTALYRAKLDGRGTYRSFELEMDARLQARRAMEMDLRRALAGHEFELHYQPLVDVAAGRVTGFEALLRWHHPTNGMVSPGDFIPVAEEIGMILPMGAWIIRTACAEAASWPDPVRVAVNVSPLQFKDPRLVELVAESLAASGLPARRLEVEITESVLLQDNEATLGVLRRLRDLGVRISMDDFGTGYSSLSYLRSFPFDKIKIDQSFVRGLKAETDSALIVGAIAGLGRSLGMRTLAEGVETHAELAQLRDAGCNEVQGYLYSLPRPANEVLSLIERINGGVPA